MAKPRPPSPPNIAKRSIPSLHCTPRTSSMYCGSSSSSRWSILIRGISPSSTSPLGSPLPPHFDDSARDSSSAFSPERGTQTTSPGQNLDCTTTSLFESDLTFFPQVHPRTCDKSMPVFGCNASLVRIGSPRCISAKVSSLIASFICRHCRSGVRIFTNAR
jgi:hypothetical protein